MADAIIYHYVYVSTFTTCVIIKDKLFGNIHFLENAKKNKYAGTKEHSIDNQQLNKMLIYVQMPKMSSHQDTI